MSGVLADRVAIVMGGASGLGEAISHRFAVEGAAVVVADIDGTGAERVAMEIRAAGNAAASAPCDVHNRADVEATVEVAKVMGRLGVLVLSAAIESFTPVTDLSDDEWQHVLDVNLTGPFLCMRAAIPVMVANGGGSVIALGSTLGLIVAPGYPAYCASKGALVNLCKQAAIEHAPDHVRVNLLAPSATDTGLFMKVSGQAPDPEAVRAKVAAGMPMKRLGRAQEVCDAVVFLASDQSTYLSGAVIPLDGGLAARRM
jgi:NAD(P)-dependent dehydrogenase (short-subunit alcohol dehydrogenase family)